MFDVRYSILDVRYSILDIRYSILEVDGRDKKGEGDGG